MRKYARVLLAMLALTFPASQAHGEDASALLKLYGNKVLDPAKEAEKLKNLEQEYELSVRDVSSRTMLDTAQSLEQEYARERLAEADKALYELSDRLNELEEEMREQAGADVTTILKLDAEYRSTESVLRRKTEERKALAIVSPSMNIDSDLPRDKRKLQSLQGDLERQRKQVDEATSYVELGSVSDFVSPLSIPVRITSPYGERLDPLTRDAITFHSGIDLAAPVGTPVLSAFRGRIAETGEDESLGLYVWVEHGNGIRTLYGHLSSIFAIEGQEVEQYDRIALSGNTGDRTTGEHLHFAVTVNDVTVDPAAFVKESN